LIVQAAMSRILIFSRDPGGANAVIPLVQPLRQEGYDVVLYGKDSALAKYREHAVGGLDIKEELEEISVETLKRFVSRKQPRLIITGTSADDATEKHLWRVAELLGISSFAILDQWINYGLRFSPYGVAEADMFNRNPCITYLPSKICVMDELAQKEAAQEGIARERLVITGQPYFETVVRQAALAKPALLRNKLLIKEDEKVLLFVSEPICATYKETDTSEHYWGYTERSIFHAILQAVQAISDSVPMVPTILVRHHPKEKNDNFKDIILSSGTRCRIITDAGSEVADLINAADLILGMSSMLLIEGAICGKRVLNVQIGLHRKDPFVLNRMGVTQAITDRAGLEQSLTGWLRGYSAPAVHFNFIKNPVSNIIKEVKKIT
jgi:hypothetical protein